MAGISRHPASEDEDAEEDSLPSKRQKVVAACDQCRAKKIKCNGNKPVCAPCTLRSGPSAMCEWTQRKGRGKAALTKDKLLQLAQRIEELEAEKHASSHRVTAQPSNFTAQSMPAINATVDESAVYVTQATDSQTPAPHSAATDELVNHQAFATTASPIPSLSTDEHEQDQGIERNAMMGFVGSVNSITTQSSKDSSLTSFMNQIRSLVDRETSQSHTSPASSLPSSTQRSFYRKRPRCRAPLNYDLPARQRADHFLSVYRRLVSPLYPFLDLEETETLYLRLWTGEDLGQDGLTFVCLINIVFSLACNLDSSIPPQQRTTDADVFYRRASELLQWDLVHEPSLLLVQCFLLMGQYLQSSDDPERCWMFVGFAIRIAQSLRLDITSTSAQEPVKRRELMRRVWHGCILMDRILSMTFGRPSVLASQASVSVPLPLAHPGKPSCQCAGDPANDATDYHFYVETLKLYSFMNEILLLLYNPDAESNPSGDSNSAFFGTSGPKLVGDLLEMDEKLRSWFRGLPSHLQRNTMDKRHVIHERQTNILAVRHKHLQILLFRPIFARYCLRGAMQQADSSTSGEDGLPEKVTLQFSIACVRAAMNLIGIFETVAAERNVEELDEFLPAWWYSIFYIYTAATVLVAARLNPSILAEVTEQSIRQSWLAATSILSQFEVFGRYAKQCSTAVRLLSDLMNQQTQSQLISQERSEARARPSPIASASQDFQTPCDSPSTIGAGIHTQDWCSSRGEFERLRKKTSTMENVLRHFNTSGVQVDMFGDMSWISGMPSRRY